MQLMNQCRNGFDCLDHSLPSGAVVELGWGAPLACFQRAGEGKVLVTTNHLLHRYNMAAARLYGGATCTHFVDLLQHSIPIREKARRLCFSECEELIADEHYIWVPG